MFGAYWCSHCIDQKNTLGKDAFQLINYVECDEDGVQSKAPACKAREIPGFPTWEIGGKLFPGEKSLDALEEILGSEWDACMDVRIPTCYASTGAGWRGGALYTHLRGVMKSWCHHDTDNAWIVCVAQVTCTASTVPARHSASTVLTMYQWLTDTMSH